MVLKRGTSSWRRWSPGLRRRSYAVASKVAPTAPRHPQAVHGADERLPGDPVHLVHRRRRVPREARRRPTSSTTCSGTRGSRAETRSSRTCTSASAQSRRRLVLPLRRQHEADSVPERRGHGRGRRRGRPTSSGRTARASSPASFDEILRAMRAGQATRTSTRRAGPAARSAARSTTRTRRQVRG